jgi:hypothetical protein
MSYRRCGSAWITNSSLSWVNHHRWFLGAISVLSFVLIAM